MRRVFSEIRNWLNRPIESRIDGEKESVLSHISEIQHEFLSKFNQIEEKVDFLTVVSGNIARSNRLFQSSAGSNSSYPKERDVSYDQSFDNLSKINPKLFPIWAQLFENGARSYVEERLGSCSHREHYHAKLFGMYLELFGHGLILDIGCGPYGMPSYLAMRDPQQVFGLEPLPMMVDPGYTVRRGFNEFLPWEDGQFDTVVSGTSLDHVLSLDVSLSEVRRVLKPSGKYVVWLASIPGAAPFDETVESFQPIDRFHLFHFDRAWIEPVFERYFNIADVTIVPQVGFDHVFYCLEPLPLKSEGN